MARREQGSDREVEEQTPAAESPGRERKHERGCDYKAEWSNQGRVDHQAKSDKSNTGHVPPKLSPVGISLAWFRPI